MLGYGLGLRTDHYTTILETHPSIDWFEIISENFLIPGGKPLYYLDQIREHYPMVMHGVSLSIGSADPLNWEYLKQLKHLAERVKPMWMSDHLCWTGVNKLNMHDLLPLPYTEEAIQHIVQRIQEVQDFLGRQLSLENVSSYLSFKDSEFTEWDFLRTIAEEANCRILLDINNIYVSSYNHGFDPMEYLQGIPVDRVQQFHLAGHTNYTTHIIDTHGAPIIDEVWQLYAAAVKRFGRVATMIERDDNIPPLSELLQELEQAKDIANAVLSNATGSGSENLGNTENPGNLENSQTNLKPNNEKNEVLV
jgi:hypothetical protein